MTSTAAARISHRDFIRHVRAKLDACGHADIAISRQWIDESTPGEAFLLNVPVGTDLVVPLMPTVGLFERSVAEADREIGQFAKALVNLRAAEKMLATYVRDVRRAASQEIAAARAAGLDLLLEGVDLRPTYAVHLTHKSWKEAAGNVLASVRVRNTSFLLRPETTELLVVEPAEAADEIAALRGQQRERQERLVQLDRMGADLEFDVVTLELLEAHGLEASAVLQRVWHEQCVELTVQHLGRDAKLSLTSFEGRLRASLELEDAYWNGEHLWFLKEELYTGHADASGKLLGDRVQHPVLARQLVSKVVPHPAGRELVFLDLSDKLLFDADTGRIWRREHLAA